MARFLQWAMPGIVFSAALAFAACSDAASDTQQCAPSGGTSGSSGGTSSSSSSSGASSSGNADAGPIVEEAPGGSNTNGSESFDHTNDPGESGSKDPFEILKERNEEGPPQIRTRLHSCTKLPYSSIGNFLSSRGVNMASAAVKSAGQLYQSGGDALGIARFDAREGELYFHTTAGATKLFDIFVQASSEIIANIGDPAKAPACTVNGKNDPMFAPDGKSCTRDALSCITGRPASEDDEILCELMLSQAHAHDGLTYDQDLAIKQKIAVAAFLSAAHTCE